MTGRPCGAAGKSYAAVMNGKIRILAVLLALSSAQPALADEIFGGVAAHQALTPFAENSEIEGVDVQLGYRFDRIEKWSAIGKPAPYLLASINVDDGTSFAAAGLSWKIGDRIYLRPAFGVAIHDGPKLRFASDGSQTQLGSRVVFAPELSIGAKLSDRASLEATIIHLSHARIFNSVQNPGLDTIGIRLVLALP